MLSWETAALWGDVQEDGPVRGAGKEPWEGSGAAQSGMRASKKGLGSFTNDKSD